MNYHYIEYQFEHDCVTEYHICTCINNMLQCDAYVKYFLINRPINKDQVDRRRCGVWNDKLYRFIETECTRRPISCVLTYGVQLNPFELNYQAIKCDIISQALCSLHTCICTQSKIYVDKSRLKVLDKLVNSSYFPVDECSIEHDCGVIERQFAKNMGFPDSDSLISAYNSPSAISTWIVIDRSKLNQTAQTTLSEHFLYLFRGDLHPLYYQYAEDVRKGSEGDSLFTLQVVTAMYCPVTYVCIKSDLFSQLQLPKIRAITAV